MPVLLKEDFVLVTNNGRDFKALLGDKDAVHPGLVIVVTQVRPSAQVILLRAVLDHLGKRGDLVNRVVEVDVDEPTKSLLSATEALPDARWKEIEAQMKPVVVERGLP